MAGGWLHETCYSPVNTDKNKCSSGSAANDMKDTVVDLNSNGDTTTHMNEDPSPRPHYTNRRNIMVALWTTCMILLTFVVAVIICLQHNRINDLQKQMETLSQFIVKNRAPAGLHLPLHHNASTVPPTSSSSVPEHLDVVTTAESDLENEDEAASRSRRNHHRERADTLSESVNKALAAAGQHAHPSIRLIANMDYKPDHRVCYHSEFGGITQLPYLLWEDPASSANPRHTHNTFPAGSYHRDHIEIPTDGLYAVNGQVTFSGREGNIVRLPCAANLVRYKGGNVDTSPEKLTQLITTQESLGRTIRQTTDVYEMAKDTIALTGTFEMRKGDYLRLEMDSFSRGCCYAAHKEKTSFGVVLMSSTTSSGCKS